MTYKEVKESYINTIEHERIICSQLSKVIFKVGTIRLLLVLFCIALSYVVWHNTLLVISVISFSVILFLGLMVYHNKLFKKRLYSETQINNAENELKAFDYDYSAFNGGEEFINSEHNYSFDLDLFGNRSFFQSINRTVTSFGKEYLAKLILYPFQKKKDISRYQNGVKEISLKTQLIAHFRAIGKMSDLETLSLKSLTSAFNFEPFFKRSKFWTTMLFVVPLFYIIWFILFSMNVVPSNTFMLLWVLMIGLSSIPAKKIKKILDIFDKQTAVLETYSQLFAIIEKENFENSILKDIQKNVSTNIFASKAIAELKSYHNNLDLSFTFPILLIFNPFLLWNVRYAIKIEKWMEMYKDNIPQWFEALAQFDALLSQAMFAYNHPDYTYPEVSDSYVFEGVNLGHPLINRDVCVRNDVRIIKRPYFLVITGANMAGKSTYLRTIGLNHILACAGMPVCAESLVFYPNKLVTNLRTADSLADNESYFFAELKRLKMIIDCLQSDEELFIILDEILKGTNSQDKQKGSLALVKQLISLNSMGIIATHDLVLGNLEKEFPESVKDYCFEADITGNHLSFSYKIREGVAQNMNACFLMKQMGITGL